MTELPVTPVLYLVVCAAPPAQHIEELIELLHQAAWRICVIPTPRVASWLDCPALAERTGYPVRHDFQRPGDQEVLPRADSIAVVPATFNTINKWSAGINDTFALGVLNEAFGLKLPIIVAPYAKPTLAAHPEFGRSLEKLASWGVRVLPNEVIRARSKEREPVANFSWQRVVEAVVEEFRR